jgi:hypothetical protein
MSTLKEIGAILGFVAFGGLAVLVFMTFQQARHLRRLREWAGRAPERAEAEADRVAEIAAEAAAAGTAADQPEEEGPGRLERLRGEIAFRFEEFDRRSPVDGRYLLAGIVAIVVAVAVLTSGFGLVGSDEPASVEATAGTAKSEPKVEVAVLNGTATEVGGVGVVGIADRVSKEVKARGYKVGEVGNAAPVPDSVVMFADGSKSEAKQLAADVEDLLGPTDVELITSDVQEVAGKAKLALVIGQDDGSI